MKRKVSCWSSSCGWKKKTAVPSCLMTSQVTHLPALNQSLLIWVTRPTGLPNGAAALQRVLCVGWFWLGGGLGLSLARVGGSAVPPPPGFALRGPLCGVPVCWGSLLGTLILDPMIVAIFMCTPVALVIQSLSFLENPMGC